RDSINLNRRLTANFRRARDPCRSLFVSFLGFGFCLGHFLLPDWRRDVVAFEDQALLQTAVVPGGAEIELGIGRLRFVIKTAGRAWCGRGVILLLVEDAARIVLGQWFELTRISRAIGVNHPNFVIGLFHLKLIQNVERLFGFAAKGLVAILVRLSLCRNYYWLISS